MRLYRTIFFVVFLSLMALPSGSRAFDLGLTPSHVYSLWININECLIASSRVATAGTTLPSTLGAMKQMKFSGKRPADVLRELSVYRAKLDSLLAVRRLPMTIEEIPSDGTITPSDVYLNSGHILSAQVSWLIVSTGPEQTVSQFYTRHGFSRKVPSDVFSLVELAIRRIDKLLAAISKKTTGKAS